MKLSFQGETIPYSELEKFEIHCTICGCKINLLEFAEHLKIHVEELNDNECS